MTAKTYKQFIIVALAIFAAALLWPGFVIETYHRLNEYARVQTPSAATIDVANINFDVKPLPGVDTATSTQPVRDIANINRLIVPRMGVDAEVFDGPDESTLRKGLWHIPGSAVPGENGNIVISAHRWLYKPPNPKTFYLIDKMQIGDPIYYDYKGSRYTYIVTETLVVNPEDVRILKQDKNKLTLFTCTPLYSTKQRAVVVAELVSVTPLVK